MLSFLLRLALLTALFLLSSAGMRTIYRNNSQAIALKPLALNPDDPSKKNVGELEFLNAWELGSDNNDFGGISALVALPGGRFMGVSDAGTLIGFGLTLNQRIDRPFIAAMPGAYGPDVDYADRDSEGIAFDPTTKRFWVSYEGKHAIRRFTPSFARIDGKTTANEMENWGSNSGGEAFVRLPDGRFLLFSEGMDRADGSYEALFFSGDPVEPGTTYFAFGYEPPNGYKPTDATMLPDGRLLLLTRRIAVPEGFSAKLVVLDISKIQKYEAVKGRIIATLSSPLLVDNMEGITVTKENGRTIIWMISDNNFNIWQRTILMKFALRETSDEATKKPEAENAPGFESL
jgi:hypothetical protein